MEKSFKDCNLKFLEKTFGIEQIDTLPDLDSWLAMPSETSSFEEESLLHLRKVLTFNIHDWNEFELDSHFIGPIFTLVDFSTKKFNHYSQRYLQGQVGDYQLYGKPDGIVSAGRREPETPYFAFQERIAARYKKELDPNGDPAGQALAAMLVGQSLNDDFSKPIYGCYVNGRDWYFMVLLGKEYSISQDFSATTNDIFKIFSTLKALKEIVTKLTA